MHENHLESKTKSPTSRLGSPCMVNVMELEIPSAMETDENVEKAEAYTKELDNVSKLLLLVQWLACAIYLKDSNALKITFQNGKGISKAFCSYSKF